MGFSLWWLPLLWSMGPMANGLQYLWHAALVALWHVESSWSIGRQIIYLWTTMEVLHLHY